MNLTLKQITKLGPTKLKPFSNSKLNTGQMIISALDRLEKIGEMGKTLTTTRFPSPTVFSQGFSHGYLKVWIL